MCDLSSNFDLQRILHGIIAQNVPSVVAATTYSSQCPHREGLCVWFRAHAVTARCVALYTVHIASRPCTSCHVSITDLNGLRHWQVLPVAPCGESQWCVGVRCLAQTVQDGHPLFVPTARVPQQWLNCLAQAGRQCAITCSCGWSVLGLWPQPLITSCPVPVGP